VLPTKLSGTIAFGRLNGDLSGWFQDGRQRLKKLKPDDSNLLRKELSAPFGRTLGLGVNSLPQAAIPSLKACGALFLVRITWPSIESGRVLTSRTIEILLD